MITFFARRFIPDCENTSSPPVRLAYGLLSSIVGILLNLLLFAGKLAAGFFSHSVAITADAFNNLSDAGSSLITLIGFRLSSHKPDPDHPFGHGRVEYLTGLAVSVLILLMGVELIKSSFRKILAPESVVFSPLVIVILLISILTKIYMAYYNRQIGQKIDSASMKATALDSLSDTVATSVVLFSTLVASFTSLQIDGYCGLLVGVLICYAGIRSAKDTINPLLGTPPSKEFVEQIEAIVMSYPLILGIHDLIVHDYGPGRVMISLHAEVPASGDILAMHDTIDVIEFKLRNSLNCEAVIHMDPIMNDDPETLSLKKQIDKLITDFDATITMHDFRIVRGPTHTNIMFDLVLPYQYRMTEKEVSTYFFTEIQKVNPTYYPIIHMDTQYS